MMRQKSAYHASDFSEPHAAAAMGNISINLPKFWENDVSLWFLMVLET